MSGFTPSIEQSAFFAELLHGTTNILLSACAGSGKTTTIIEGLKTLPVRNAQSFLPPKTTFLTFNKSIAETLKARCPSHVACATFHSLGFRALKASGLISESDARKRDFVNSRKVSKLLYNSLGDGPDTKDAIRLASLARSTPRPPEQIDHDYLSALAEANTLFFDDTHAAFSAVSKAILSSSRDLSSIDFDEMLYLPVIHGCSFDTQDYVFVDEAQDTNEVQLTILERLNKGCGPLMQGMINAAKAIPNPSEFNIPPQPTTRYVLVGDEAQAIYAFRGANSDSMSRIATRFECKKMPLSVSFRCPQAVVAEARKFLGAS